MTETEEMNRNGFEIAVVGMSGRFPGADNLDEFWENLKKGVSSIRFFSDEELLEKASIDPNTLKLPNFVKAKGIIRNIEYFDAFFFGYSPIEAEIMNPQLRIFYEICWEALEDAACDPAAYDGPIGVYAGGTSSRWWEVLAIISGKTKVIGDFASSYLIDKDVIGTRIAYKLDLKGPAVSLHTACSTALTAVDLACRSLLTGQCDAALAGGSSTVPQVAKAGGYLYEEGLIRSPDGFVRAFDARAKGVVFSDGAGVVLLKRLDDALNDGNEIYAVIKGFYLNNDGIGKSSFSAPALDGQEEVIKAARYMAEVEPESITYVETHGTATEMGDPIEVEALRRAFKTDKRHYCAIGSVKTNIGHLDTAAGIASLIKVALMMKNRQIPPSLNFEEPNPKIDFENSPFFVNTELREWKSSGYPLRAGVSSFGVGGTNAHLVLEEAPQLEPTSQTRSFQLVLLSARSAKALDQATENFVNYLKKKPEVNLADAAYTLKAGRKAFEHRKMMVCSDVQECLVGFESAANESSGDSQHIKTHFEKEEKRAVFMFPGQGSQYVNMALGLYENEPVFRREMDRCFEILKPLMDFDLKEVLYPLQSAHAGQDVGSEVEAPEEDNSGAVNQTAVTQPLIFTIEYALAKLLLAWGITPYAMIGHSIGEYTAACLAGVFTLADALTVVVWRGKLMQQMSSGSMLSVPLPEKELKPLLNDELALAAVNGPSQCVVSGPHAAIEAFARILEEKDIQYRKLHTSHAFHSAMMDPILKDFERKVAQVTLNRPGIPFISNVTGKWITFQDAADPGYWSRHVRSTVRFADGAAELLKEEHSLFIEVGPGRTLNTFVRQHPDKQPDHKSVNLVRHPKEEVDDLYYLLNKLGQIWLYRVPIDWNAFYSEEKRRRLRLPTYPFQRQPYWLEGNPVMMIKQGLGGQFSPGKKSDISDWFYIPSWKRSFISVADKMEPTDETHPTWLLFADDGEFTSRLIKELTGKKENNHKVVIVRPGGAFAKQEDGSYTVSPGQEEDYEALINDLFAAKRFPHKIVHSLNLTSGSGNDPVQGDIEESLDRGFYSLLYLVQALGKREFAEQVEITVLTDGMFEVWDEKVLYPGKAVLLGPLMVIPLEYPEMKCRCIDIMLPGALKGKEEWLIRQLLEEFHSPIIPGDEVIAFRGRQRLVRTFEAAALNQSAAQAPRLRQGGVYLITGGLGGIGLVLARHLAGNLQAKLCLTGRTDFPARQEWQEWLDSHPSLDSVSQKIRKVKELESLGAEVRVFCVDAIDAEGMRNLVEEVYRQFGAIHGVIHAAGVPGGGMIQLKTREIADSVLAPKVRGTLALHRALKGKTLDFLLFCSSINAVLPILGQVDYFAANAFMDAFAFYRNAVDEKTFTVSINWDAWQEVGMAVEAAKQFAGDKYDGESQPRQMDHPLFDHYVARPHPAGPGPAMYTTYFSLKRHWVLSGHRTQEKKGLVPGVTYLEMAHAAFKNLFSQGDGEGVVEIRGVSFLNPLIVEEGEEREVRMVLKPNGKNFEFLVCSRITAGEAAWQNHAKGEVVLVPRQQEEPVKHDLREIAARCNLEEINIDVGKKKRAKKSLVIFGPRWNNILKVKIGKNEALAYLELPGEFAAELAQYTLYPSILDNAAAFFYGSINSESAYIPFSYKKLIVSRPFPARVYAHSRLTNEQAGESSREFLKFNVTVMAEDGTELVDIEEFTLLEISDEIFARLKDKEQGDLSVPGKITPAEDPEEMGIAAQDLVKDGIAPPEGVEAFTRILAQDQAQVVVSTRDLTARFAAGRAADAVKMAEDMNKTSPQGPAHARPDISTAYAAPADGTEQKLANIWQELLGIEQIGVDDDFFELGGDSLKATTMITKINQAFDVEIKVRDIFNSSHIRDLSKILDVVEETVPRHVLIEPVEKREYYPLSPMQRKLYVLDQMEGIQTAYNLPSTMILEKKPDVHSWERACRLLIARHESLRTSFEIRDGQPVQFVHEQVDFNIEYIKTKEEQISEVIAGFIRPFDLSKAPLMRIAMLNIEEKKYGLVLDLHHIVSDGTSFVIKSRDIRSLLESKDNSENLPKLRLQYKDFTLWQNSEAGKTVIKKQEEYWLDRFKGEIPKLEMFTDYPRPRVQSFAGDRMDFEFDEALTLKLHQLMKETGTTLFMVLMAVYNILLAKYSGQEDIIVGTPTAGREHVDLDNIIGLFINVLAIRNYPGGDKTFAQFLQEVRDSSLGAFENQAYPFGDLVDALGLYRDLSRNPLYDAELIVQNIDKFGMEIEGTEFVLSRYESKRIQHELSLEAVEGNKKIVFVLRYCTDLYKEETIDKFIDFFRQTASTVAGNKDITLADIKVPSELEIAETKSPRVDEIEFGF